MQHYRQLWIHYFSVHIYLYYFPEILLTIHYKQKSHYLFNTPHI